MTCVGVPLKVSSNEVIPEYSEKHNFTIHGFFQNLSTWYHDHDWAQYGGIGTTYIKNGKYIYRKIPRRQTLPVMTAINGSGHVVNTKITFGTDASPIFKFGTNDMTGLGNRIEVDGSEIIFRLTPGMNLLPGDNITFMLPGFSNSPNPFSFRDDGANFWRPSLTNVSYVMTDDLYEQMLQTFDAVLAGWPLERECSESST